MNGNQKSNVKNWTTTHIIIMNWEKNKARSSCDHQDRLLLNRRQYIDLVIIHSIDECLY